MAFDAMLQRVVHDNIVQRAVIGAAAGGVAASAMVVADSSSGNRHNQRIGDIGYGAAGLGAVTAGAMMVLARHGIGDAQTLERAAAPILGVTIGAGLAGAVTAGNVTTIKDSFVTDAIGPSVTVAGASAVAWSLGHGDHVEQIEKTAKILSKHPGLPWLLRQSFKVAVFLPFLPYAIDDIVSAGALGVLALRHRPLVKQAWADAGAQVAAKSAKQAAAKAERAAKAESARF